MFKHPAPPNRWLSLLRKRLRERPDGNSPPQQDVEHASAPTTSAGNDASSPPPPTTISGSIHASIDVNVAKIQSEFPRTDDLVIRPIMHAGRHEATAVFMHSAISTVHVSQFVMTPLLKAYAQNHPSPADAITSAKIDDLYRLENAASALVEGGVVVFFRDTSQGKILWMEDWEGRSIGEATTEVTQSGPMEGFSESLSHKMSQIRRRIRSPQLRFDTLHIGAQTNTPVTISYLRNIVRPGVVDEMRRRLQSFVTDGIIDVNHIKEMILDEPWSPWPAFMITERPDRAVAHLLEGQLVVMIEGSPWVLIAPATVDSFMQAPDDYYMHFYVASFVRGLRWVGAMIALIAPSFYVSILTYQHELIPSGILFTILSSREQLPFPPFLEAFIMESIFEILREAGLRMPQQVGPALSIVGVLVIGDAAVNAGLISPLMIVVVGMTAISGFIIPSRDFSNAIRILRFPALIFAGFAGLFGMLVYLMFIFGLLIRMRSLATPVTSPLIPAWTKGFTDSTIRAPWWKQHFRPWHSARPEQVRSQPEHQSPADKK